MPDERRSSRTALPGAQRALAALLAGADGDPAELQSSLTAAVLRLVFLRRIRELPGDPSWPALLACFDRCFAERGVPLFDPRRHPILRTLAPTDAAIAAALRALAEVTELGAAYESLLALQLSPDLRLHAGVGRRRSGAHYTPAALTSPLVAATLRPLLAEHPPPTELRVCDPAMGCGAFLLAACDALAAGDMIAARRDAAAYLHGVDLDPLAVELARLSLWLHVGDPTLPTSAYDHTLRHGDSLVGLGPTESAPDTLHADATIAAFFAHPTRRARPPAPEDRSNLHNVRAELRARDVHPFHWPLEFPAVFARGGFDVVLGNPPFFWGNRIGRTFGEAYRDWLQHLHPGAHGNSDLAAHFLRRAFTLLRPGGCLGFITTNSISEAETRATGLVYVRTRGGVLYEAVRDLPWPGDASVRVAQLCLRRGPVPVPHLLDGRPVTAIGDDLRPSHAGAAPRRLPARARQSFKGVDFGGTGFLLSAPTHASLSREAPGESAYIWPVLNASGFTTSPQLAPDAHIINFSGLSLADAAAAAPRCLEIVTREVLPRRSVDRRSGRRERWWIYNEACPGLYQAIAGLPRVLVGPVVAKHLVFGFVAPRVVFTNALNVFAFAGAEMLALLQSRVHETWALRHASSLRSDPRYNPTTCFETFPFPPLTPALGEAGAAYDTHRAALMRRNREGLTLLYNRFHAPSEVDPEIVRLRELHAALDHAVLTAFAWPDLIGDCEFSRDARGRWRLGWSQARTDEVHARLLALNLASGRPSIDRGDHPPA